VTEDIHVGHINLLQHFEMRSVSYIHLQMPSVANAHWRVTHAAPLFCGHWNTASIVKLEFMTCNIRHPFSLHRSRYWLCGC